MTQSPDTPTWPQAGKGGFVALVAGLVAGRSLAQIAAAAGCSISSVQRRRRDPRVQQAIHDAQQDQRRQILGQLGAARSKAMLVLEDLLENDQPKVRLAAVNVELTQGLRYELAAEPELEPQHTTGADPDAETILADQMGEHAWDVESSLLVEDDPNNSSDASAQPATAAETSARHQTDHETTGYANGTNGANASTDHVTANVGMGSTGEVTTGAGEVTTGPAR